MFRRTPSARALLVTAMLALSSIGASACSGPCRALSDQICECKPNEPERAACRERVRLSESQKPEVSIAEEAVCEQRLDDCTCEALTDGDLAACGLAKTP